MKALTVYCASSERLDPAFRDAARTLGAELARRSITLVYGGGRIGLMGEVARAAREHGGRVVGVITRKLIDLEQLDDECDEILIVDTMRERKQLLAERGDGFVVLPGGIGTYEEFFEVLVGRQLGDHLKPIGVVNVQMYFDPLIAMMEHGITHRFIRPALSGLFHVDPDPLRVVEHMLTDAPKPTDLRDTLPMHCDGE